MFKNSNLKSKISNLKSGFTLIELLVVISIIGLLATLLMANLNAARSRARDAERKSDLRNIATALRLFYNDYGKYPKNDTSYQIVGCGTAATTGDPTNNLHSCAWGDQWQVLVSSTNNTTTYMSKLPADPLQAPSYEYISDSVSDTYQLLACLENASDPNGVAVGKTGWTGTTCPSGTVFQIIP
jgi:type II secretion system protein G